MTGASNLEPEAIAIEKLVMSGRRKFKELLGDTDQSFDDVIWNIGTLLRRFTATENVRLLFMLHDSKERPLPEGYANVVKSCLLLSEASARHGRVASCCPQALVHIGTTAGTDGAPLLLAHPL